MNFLGFKNWASSWTTWVLGAVTVTPVLNSNVEMFTNLIPEQYKGWAITILGVIGLIARAIPQKSAFSLR